MLIARDRYWAMICMIYCRNILEITFFIAFWPYVKKRINVNLRAASLRWNKRKKQRNVKRNRNNPKIARNVVTSLSYQDEEKLESPFEHFLGVTCFQYLARSTTSHIVLSRWRSHEVGDARKEHPRLKQRRRRFPWIIEPRNLSQGMQPVASFPESSGFPEWREEESTKEEGNGGGWRMKRNRGW